MFNVGDYVFNQKTGHIGKVVGYDHQMLKSGYTSTLNGMGSMVGNAPFSSLLFQKT